MKFLKDASGWIIIIAIFCSCSTTSKNKSSYKSKTDTAIDEKKGIDTSAQFKADLQQKNETETTTGSKTDTDILKELNIDFGNGTDEDYTGIKKDTSVAGIKITTTGPGTIKLNIDGSVEATGNIKKASYKETGKIKKQDSSRKKEISNTQQQVTNQKKGIDTSAKKTQTTTQVVIKQKDVQRTSYWGWLWLGLITAAVIGVGWYFGWWRWFFAFIRRTKNKNEYRVKYSKYQPPKPPTS